MNPFSSPSSSFPSHHHHHRSPAFIPHPPGTGNGGNANPPSGSWLESRYDPGDDRLSQRSTEEEPEEAGVLPVLGTSRTHGPAAEIEKEHMFDKVVTPSDVGKLNRLVIPKQHAERYFPLDSSSNEKGLLLNFEDRTGKPWRFRYSYWNSSQSYVITKGWSRFVKEKKLDAGDIVSFQRGVGEAGKDRLFIDWRRHPGHCHRSTVTPHPFLIPHGMDHHRNGYMGGSRVNYGYGNVVCGEGSLFYLSRSSLAPSLPLQVGVREVHGGGGGAELPIPVVFNSVPVVQGKAAAKRLRLFGVNMDCPILESTDEHRQGCEILSSTSISHATAIRSQPPPTICHQLQPISAPSPPFQSPHLQLELYNGMPLISKGKASSSMSLDGQLR